MQEKNEKLVKDKNSAKMKLQLERTGSDHWTQVTFSCTHSLDEYLLNDYNVLITILGAGEIAINRISL